MVESNAFAIFRNKCWILNVRGLIKKVVTDCLHCWKASATSNPPFMADIPEERLQHNNKPLTNMGTDYSASFSIKLSKGSRSNAAKEERYRIIFTCMAMYCTFKDTEWFVNWLFILLLKGYVAWRRQVRPLMNSDHTSDFN